MTYDKKIPIEDLLSLIASSINFVDELYKNDLYKKEIDKHFGNHIKLMQELANKKFITVYVGTDRGEEIILGRLDNITKH